MVDQSGFFDMSDRLWDLLAKGDDLARIAGQLRAIPAHKRKEPALAGPAPVRLSQLGRGGLG
jgi:hypothetical protein